jgi:hypothetical protein
MFGYVKESKMQVVIDGLRSRAECAEVKAKKLEAEVKSLKQQLAAAHSALQTARDNSLAKPLQVERIKETPAVGYPVYNYPSTAPAPIFVPDTTIYNTPVFEAPIDPVDFNKVSTVKEEVSSYVAPSKSYDFGSDSSSSWSSSDSSSSYSSSDSGSSSSSSD